MMEVTIQMVMMTNNNTHHHHHWKKTIGWDTQLTSAIFIWKGEIQFQNWMENKTYQTQMLTRRWLGIVQQSDATLSDESISRFWL